MSVSEFLVYLNKASHIFSNLDGISSYHILPLLVYTNLYTIYGNQQNVSIHFCVSKFINLLPIKELCDLCLLTLSPVLVGD